MKRFALILLFATSVISCGKKEHEHLNAAKMQAVLYDIHLAEVYSIVIMKDSNNRNTQRNTDSLAKFYRTVFRHHNITWPQFKESLDWYKEHPEEMDSVYNRMIPEMSKLEGRYSLP